MKRDLDLSGVDVGIYPRISESAEDDTTGVDNQDRDLTRLALSANARSVTRYTENNTSAYKQKRIKVTDPTTGEQYFAWRVIRPEWQRLLSDLRRGTIQAALVHNLDRLARDPRDLEDAIEIVRGYGRILVAYEGELDLMTETGQMVARIQVGMANQQSASSARRQRNSHRHRAEKGIPVGAHRPFGWEKDKRTLRPAEAALVREAADRILRGDSVMVIVKDWNQRKISTPRNSVWRRTTLLEMMRNPRLAGFRTLNGEIYLHPDTGERVIGQWEPILDVETWESIVAITKNPRTGTGQVAGRKYWLSNILRCANPVDGDICGFRMTGTLRTIHGVPTFRYECKPQDGGCGSLSIRGEYTDKAVLDVFMAYYATHLSGQRQELPAVWDREEEWLAIDREVQENAQARSEGVLSLREYLQFRDAIEARRKALEASRNAFLTARAKAAEEPVDLLRDWERLTLDRRREALSQVVEAIMVQPVKKKGSKVFDPTRLEIVWK